MILGTQEAYDVIDRKSLYNFLLSVKTESGVFRMCIDGESDTRAMYCALAVASITNILDDKLSANCLDYLERY